MTPSLHNTSTAASGAAGTSLTINVPSGLVDGDGLILLIVTRGGSGVTVSTPSGWTPVLSANQGTGVRLAIFSRVASSEPASYTVSWTGGSFNASGGIYAAQGSDTTNLVNASGAQGNATINQVTAPSITTTVDNCLLLFFGGAQATPTWTADGSMSQRWAVPSTAGSTDCTSECADQALGAAGSTGTRASSLSAGQNNVGALVALAPLAVAGGDVPPAGQPRVSRHTIYRM